jgi:hypothetical protein
MPFGLVRHLLPISPIAQPPDTRVPHFPPRCPVLGHHYPLVTSAHLLLEAGAAALPIPPLAHGMLPIWHECDRLQSEPEERRLHQSGCRSVEPLRRVAFRPGGWRDRWFPAALCLRTSLPAGPALSGTARTFRCLRSLTMPAPEARHVHRVRSLRDHSSSVRSGMAGIQPVSKIPLAFTPFST